MEGDWKNVKAGVGSFVLLHYIPEKVFNTLKNMKSVKIESVTLEADFLGGKIEGLNQRVRILIDEASVCAGKKPAENLQLVLRDKNHWWKEYKSLTKTFTWQFGKEDYDDVEAYNDEKEDGETTVEAWMRLPAVIMTYENYMVPNNASEDSKLWLVRAIWQVSAEHLENRTITASD